MAEHFMDLRKWPLALRLTLHLLSAGIACLLYKYELFPASTSAYIFVQLIRILSTLFFLFLLFNGYWKFQLHTKIFIGLLLGIIAGLLIGSSIGEIKPVGDAFIRLISLIVVPLVFASLLVGTASLNDIRKLGRIGGKTIGYYLITTSIAILIGLTLANLIDPGKNINPRTRAELLKNYQQEAQENIQKVREKPNVVETLLDIIPKNPVHSLANGRMLQIIFFAMLLGIALTLIPSDKSGPVISLFDGLNDAMIRTVHIVIAIAPYGVFALIANIIGQYGTGILRTLLKYSFTVILGLFIHATVVYPAILKIFTPIKIKKFFQGIRQAQLIAFSSSSSSATLPVTIECVEENLGVSPNVASFVLPLGATINMDGTALYQGVSAVFIAQVYGLALGPVEQLTVLLTATLASIGAAGVPGIGMITLAIVLESINIPLEGIALILGVERILDMCRTVVNITGDASASIIIAATEGELKTPEA